MIVSGWVLGNALLGISREKDPITWNVQNVTYDTVVSAAAGVFENEQTTRAATDYGLNLMSGIVALDPNYREVFRVWIRRAWTASRLNGVEEFMRRVQEQPGYLLLQEKKPEGWFMRRWRNVGGGEHGLAMNALYRLGLLRAAMALDMPEIDIWIIELKLRLTTATTLAGRAGDLRELARIEKAAPEVVARAMKLKMVRRAMDGSGNIFDGE